MSKDLLILFEEIGSHYDHLSDEEFIETLRASLWLLYQTIPTYEEVYNGKE